MRTIDATLLSNQSSFRGDPALSLVIGTAPSTVDVSSFVLAYDYEEDPDTEQTFVITLDNQNEEFSTLSGDYANVAQGAVIEFKRGLTVSGTDYLEELPRCWIECISYEYGSGRSICVLECVDWLGKLARWQASADKSWSSTSVTTILEWILTQVGLTRLSGTMTSLSIDFDISQHDPGDAAINRLMRKIPEYLYPGLDAEIKWSEIDAGDAAEYTVGWNAQHPVLSVEAGDCAWEINSIRVDGSGSYDGSATDNTQISAVGTRHLSIYDTSLKSDADCAQRAQAELDLYEAFATEATIVCRPIHGLELFDVIKVDNPPWNGSDVTGRVIHFREVRDTDGRWYQVITLGQAPDKDPGAHPTHSHSSGGGSSSNSGSTSRRRKRRRRWRRWRRRVWRLLHQLLYSIRTGTGDFGTTPIGGIILWSGAVAEIPNSWALCDGNNGTPDLRNSFVVGAGDTYDPADTGGAATNDLQHTHDPGTLGTAADAHTHGPGNLASGSDAHTHGPGNLATDSDAHTHGNDSLAADSDAHTHNLNTSTFLDDAGDDPYVGASATESDAHTHTISGATDSDSHSHSVDSGVTAEDSHSHTVDSGVTAEDSHTHTITGATANAGSTTQENLPPYYALAYIMRVI
jgi:hypothetical protein